MPRTLVSTALLSLVLCVSRARAQFCPLVDLDAGRGWPPPLAYDTPECSAALAYLPHLQSLERAAGFTEGRWRLAVQRAQDDNAYLIPKAGLLIATTEFLRRHPSADDAVLFTLAHELGHGVQEKTSPYAPDPSTPEAEQDRADRRREAHADALGRDILARAGYDALTAVRGVEAMFGCGAVVSGTPASGPHPAARTRWINLLRLGSRAATSALPAVPPREDFDDSGKLTGPDAPSADAESSDARACGRLTGPTLEDAAAAGRALNR